MPPGLPSPALPCLMEETNVMVAAWAGFIQVGLLCCTGAKPPDRRTRQLLDGQGRKRTWAGMCLGQQSAWL